MNLEERMNLQERVHKLEGLLAYAEQTHDEPEIARLRVELMAAIEQCGDGCCCCSCVLMDAIMAFHACEKQGERFYLSKHKL